MFCLRSTTGRIELNLSSESCGRQQVRDGDEVAEVASYSPDPVAEPMSVVLARARPE